ncbi:MULTISPECIES: hypothetical protein [unclassified Kribbella]|uniref:hypothetical protein n=1 Tax=unclassified Kribbella TaxID=2644121 RepID=UPI003077276B
MDDPAAQVERELRAAQEQVRELGDILRAALAEDDRLAQQTNHPAPQASQSPQDHRPTTRDEH